MDSKGKQAKLKSPAELQVCFPLLRLLFLLGHATLLTRICAAHDVSASSHVCHASSSLGGARKNKVRIPY